MTEDYPEYWLEALQYDLIKNRMKPCPKCGKISFKALLTILHCLNSEMF